jgi:hypothetical protein
MSNETPRPCKDRIKAVGNKRQHDDIARDHVLALSGHCKMQALGHSTRLWVAYPLRAIANILMENNCPHKTNSVYAWTYCRIPAWGSDFFFVANFRQFVKNIFRKNILSQIACFEKNCQKTKRNRKFCQESP